MARKKRTVGCCDGLNGLIMGLALVGTDANALLKADGLKMLGGEKMERMEAVFGFAEAAAYVSSLSFGGLWPRERCRLGEAG